MTRRPSMMNIMEIFATYGWSNELIVPIMTTKFNTVIMCSMIMLVSMKTARTISIYTLLAYTYLCGEAHFGGTLLPYHWNVAVRCDTAAGLVCNFAVWCGPPHWLVSRVGRWGPLRSSLIRNGCGPEILACAGL